MIMTPKSDKDPRNVINYRPITLLEIPAKILGKQLIRDFTPFWRRTTYCIRTNLASEKIWDRGGYY